MNYPTFKVPGVAPADVWQLFNCSNYEYYCNKIKSLNEGVCGFCTIDYSINQVYFETDHWKVMENLIAPRSDKSGQEHQFVIPSRRHVANVDELNAAEFENLHFVINALNRMFDITGGVLVIRTGNPALNARSMPHLHVNYHVPTGLKRIEITIAKSQADLDAKLPILQVFEKMRVLQERGDTNPVDGLTPEERDLVKDKIAPKGSC